MSSARTRQIVLLACVLVVAIVVAAAIVVIDAISTFCASGSDASFVVEASIEPYPLRQGPAMLYFEVTPTADSELHGDVSFIGSDTIEASGPMEALNESWHIMRVPVQVHTDQASDARFGVAVERDGTMRRIVPYHDGVKSVFEEPYSDDSTDHRECVPCKERGGKFAVTFGYRRDQLFHMELEHAIAARVFDRINCDATLRPYSTDAELLTALDKGDIQFAVGVSLVSALARADYDTPHWFAYKRWCASSMTPFDGVLISRKSGAITLKDLDALTIVVPDTSIMSILLPRIGLQVRTASDAEVAELCRGLPDACTAVYATEPRVTIALSSEHYSLVGCGGVSRELFRGDEVPIALSVVSAAWRDSHRDEAACVVATSWTIGAVYGDVRGAPSVVDYLQGACGACAEQAMAVLAVPTGWSIWGETKRPVFEAIKASLIEAGRIPADADLEKLEYIP